MTESVRCALAHVMHRVVAALVTFVGLTGQAQVSEGIHGSIALVELPPDTLSVSFNESTQLIWGNYAVVGIPLDTEPGTYGISLTRADGSTEQRLLLVRDKKYKEEHIQITDDSMVTPPKLDLERINREAEAMRAVYRVFSSQPSDLVPILQPIEGRVSGEFGSRRFFNNQPRSPHSGMDLAAPVGMPIKAPAPAEVALIGDFYFNGKTVMLNHGGGFISMMCHLSEIGVEQGSKVERGDVIGKVGATGRATGPHLHWSVSLSGHRTDPATFMAILNALSDGG